MKHLILFLLSCFLVQNTFAQDISGVYTYSKGLNKANGTLYLFQFKSDSAFFYLNCLSGMPDFLTTDIKGFLRIDSTKGYIKEAESCRIKINFEKTKCHLSQDSLCKYEFNTSGVYKKTSPIPKRNPTMLLNYTEKVAKSTTDTIIAYLAPHIEAKSKPIVCKEGDIKVIDEYKQFLLIEHKKYKQEFLWVIKKNILIPKSK
jgi:hypothetical protein